MDSSFTVTQYVTQPVISPLRAERLRRHLLGLEIAKVVRYLPGISLTALAQMVDSTPSEVWAVADAESRRLISIEMSASPHVARAETSSPAGSAKPRPGGRPQFWSDEDILAALVLVAELSGGRVTFARYCVIGRRHGLPSGQTVLKRFGTWREACARAGVQAGKSGRVPGKRTSSGARPATESRSVSDERRPRFVCGTRVYSLRLPFDSSPSSSAA